MFPKIQPDTTIALFLLRELGAEQFPGAAQAAVEFWTKLPESETVAQLEQAGTLLLDMGGGRFDHHNKRPEGEKICLSEVVAAELGVRENETLAKLLAYAHRDDVAGKGTVSTDPLDRAFGLSGLIMSLNRDYPNNPQRVLDAVLPLIASHYHEEYRRYHELPKEYENKKQAGKVRELAVAQGGKNLKVILIESDNVSLPGYLRAVGKIQADVVVQRLRGGYVNVITRQWRKVDLRNLVTVLRVDEMRRRGVNLKSIDWSQISRPGFFKETPQWYYDTAANTIQNGGANPQNIEPTIIPWSEFPGLVEIGLNPRKFEETIRSN